MHVNLSLQIFRSVSSDFMSANNALLCIISTDEDPKNKFTWLFLQS